MLHVVYVPRSGRENLALGIAAGVWGWKDAAVARTIHSSGTPHTGLQAIKSTRVGDYLLLAAGGPSSRVEPGGWSTAVLRQAVLLRITHGHYISDASVWPDDVYPHRVDTEVVEDRSDVSASDLGADALECLRLSANVSGLPFRVRIGMPLAPQVPPLASGQTDDPAMVDFPGDGDAVALVQVRRDQRLIRAAKFGSLIDAQCDLCGQQLPVTLLRAGHIKRRTDCSAAERKDLSNILAACVQCDVLFEHGWVYVDSAGVVRRSQLRQTTPDLARMLDRLDGTNCPVHGPSTAAWFAAHRNRHGL